MYSSVFQLWPFSLTKAENTIFNKVILQNNKKTVKLQGCLYLALMFLPLHNQLVKCQPIPNKHTTLNQCWFDADPPSTTMDQR